jgi:hypothetical protein
MSQSQPWTALRTILERAESALKRGDAESADVAMGEAATLCHDSRVSETPIAPGALEALQELTARCGTSLAGLARALNTESLRDDNHRRALLTYQTSRPR